MKNLSLILLTIFGLVIFTSCEDDLGPVANSDPGAPELSTPESGDTYTLSQDEADETLFTLEWSKSDFGFDAAVTYTIEMAEEGTDFENPIEIGEVNETSFEITVGDMNNELLAAGFPADQEASVEIRVKGEVSDSMDPEYSDPITLTFTPYFVEVDYPSIYVPGGYQSASGYGNDWTPEDAPALASPDDNDRYEGYVYVADDDSEFKFTNERNWDDGDWGMSDTEGELESPGNNIPADAGYYKINVDLNNMTYELLNTDWGVIGDATPGGWDEDTDMEYDLDEKVWSVELELTEGEIKFRANDTWDDIDYGDNDADGTLNPGGDNIAVDDAGTYTIEMDLSQQPYRYTLTQN